MGRHFRIGPSGASQWMYCPGSVVAQEAVGGDTANIHSAEGSMLHHIAAMCLKFGLEPEDFIGKTMTFDGFTFTVDWGHADCMKPGLEQIRSLTDQFDIFVEIEVDLSPWIGEGAFGTADVILVHKRRKYMIVLDWKFGRGVLVLAERNEQGMIYGLGAWNSIVRPEYGYRLEEIETTIAIEQPRISGGNSEWDCTGEQLQRFSARVVKAVELVNGPAPVLVPGPQCTFCRAAKTCPARDEYALAAMQATFDDIDDWNSLGLPFSAKRKLSPERRTFLIQNESLIKKWIDEMKAAAAADYFAGRPTPGLKMVAGKAAARKFKQGKEKQVVRTLRKIGMPEEEIYPPSKLVSPAQVQDKIGREKYERHIDKYVEQGQGPPHLVDESASKKGLPRTADHFDELIGED